LWRRKLQAYDFFHLGRRGGSDVKRGSPRGRLTSGFRSPRWCGNLYFNRLVALCERGWWFFMHWLRAREDQRTGKTQCERSDNGANTSEIEGGGGSHDILLFRRQRLTLQGCSAEPL